MSDQTDDPLRIITFGCRLNAYESEVMRGHARDGASDGRTIVFNTCAVTAEAERQARQAIRRARREDPEARIVVTGCAAQIRPEAWADMPEVDAVLGNEDKLKADRFAAALATTPNRLAPSAPAAAGPDFVGATEPARIFVDDIMAANPKQVEQVKEKPKTMGWFVGQVMKASGGKANPQAVNEILKKKLGVE